MKVLRDPQIISGFIYDAPVDEHLADLLRAVLRVWRAGAAARFVLRAVATIASPTRTRALSSSTSRAAAPRGGRRAK